MGDRASCWSITINNPVQADEDNIAKARQRGWKVEGQLEKGKEGTPHYQLCVKTPQVRFSALKKQFPRAHIEIARNRTALESYVVKEDTREAPLKVSQDMYPSREKVFDWWAEYYYRMANIAAETSLRKKDWPLLSWWDAFICKRIEEGYYVEGIGVDPQTRSIVNRYTDAILNRWLKVRRQTDRQTDGNIVQGQDITNAIDESTEESSISWDEESCASSLSSSSSSS